MAEENNTALNDRRWIWVAFFFVAEAHPAASNQRFWVDEVCAARSAQHRRLVAPRLVFDPDPGFHAALAPPDLGAVSKSDIVDPKGVLAPYPQTNHSQNGCIVHVVLDRENNSRGNPF